MEPMLCPTFKVLRNGFPGHVLVVVGKCAGLLREYVVSFVLQNISCRQRRRRMGTGRYGPEP